MELCKLTFVTGTGRCGTVSLANILSLSPTTLAMHEGQTRDGLESAERILPHLTLQNLAGYLEPSQSESILRQFRDRQVKQIQRERPDINHLCDIAYYYAPFAAVLPRVFPESKLVVIVRDGRHFVRSAYTSEVPDPMPAGYVDEREFTSHELFCAAGRLQPREDDPISDSWDDFTPFQKNCWLWAETNRILLDVVDQREPGRVCLTRFEELFQSEAEMDRLLHYLEIEDIPKEKRGGIIGMRLNARTGTVLPHPNQWEEERVSEFENIAGATMNRLGYA